MCVCFVPMNAKRCVSVKRCEKPLILQPHHANKAWLILTATLSVPLLLLPDSILLNQQNASVCAGVWVRVWARARSLAWALSCKKWPALWGAVEEENNLW